MDPSCTPSPSPIVTPPSSIGSSSISFVYNGNGTATYSSTNVASRFGFWTMVPNYGQPLIISGSQGGCGGLLG
jgi:hypothetical protein